MDQGYCETRMSECLIYFQGITDFIDLDYDIQKSFKLNQKIL